MLDTLGAVLCSVQMPDAPQVASPAGGETPARSARDMQAGAPGGRLDDVSQPDSLSNRFRRRRDIRLRGLIAELAAQDRAIRILDLGGTVEYWRRVGIDFLADHACHVTVLNQRADALVASDDERKLFATAVGDACDLSQFADGAFDLVHSNSVIEHVGNWSRMKAFAAESRRVGLSYYVQTPYFWFPIDPHYYRAPLIHWMPRPWQAQIIKSFPVALCGAGKSLDAAYEILDTTQLIDARQMAVLFPDAELLSERLLGLTKSLMAIRRRPA